eukprot:6390429-Amphidinium_carterae.1
MTQERLEKERATLLSTDRSFIIELSLIKSMAGELGDAKVEAEFMKILPSEDKPGEVHVAVTRADAFVSGHLYKFGSKGVQGRVKVCCKFLHDLHDGIAPTLGARASQWVQTVFGKLPCFVSTTTTVDRLDNDGKKVKSSMKLVGKTAVNHIYRQVERKKEKKEEVKVDELRPLIMFTYLLDPSRQEQVQKWTGESIKNVRKRAAASGSAGEMKKAKPSTAACEALSETNALFD